MVDLTNSLPWEIDMNSNKIHVNLGEHTALPIDIEVHVNQSWIWSWFSFQYLLYAKWSQGFWYPPHSHQYNRAYPYGYHSSPKETAGIWISDTYFKLDVTK